MVGVQTLVLLVLAKNFLRAPLSLSGVLVSFLKTFFFFAPVLIVMSRITRVGAEGLTGLLILAFELSAISVLVVSAVKAILLHLHTDGENN